MAGNNNGIVGNPETGDVTVHVRDREYTLKLSINASVQLEQRRKRPLGDIVKDFASMNTESMRDVLFVCLQRHHKDEIKRLEDAGVVLDDLGPQRFFAAFTEMMKQGTAEGATSANGSNPQTATTADTGESSTSPLVAQE